MRAKEILPSVFEHGQTVHRSETMTDREMDKQTLDEKIKQTIRHIGINRQTKEQTEK